MKSLGVLALSASLALAAAPAGAVVLTYNFDGSPSPEVIAQNLAVGDKNVSFTGYEFTDVGGNNTSGVRLIDLDNGNANVTGTFNAGGFDIDSSTAGFGGEFIRIGDVGGGSDASVNGQATVSPFALLFAGLDATTSYALEVFDTNANPETLTATFVSSVPTPAAGALFASALIGVAALGATRRRRG